MSRLARRVLAFLSGLNDPRPGLARIAGAVRRSKRSVRRAIAELQHAGRIEAAHTGHGVMSKITVINGVDAFLASESKMASERPKVAPESRKMASESACIKVLGKVLEQEQAKQQRKPMGVEMPPETLTNEHGRVSLNPAWVRCRDALVFARERIARAHDPEAYARSIVDRERIAK